VGWYCAKDGIRAVPDQDLPVDPAGKTPRLTGEGGSPLAATPEVCEHHLPEMRWSPARRETDTMDTFVDSSWYFYRYCDPHKRPKLPTDAAKVGYWFPIDQYIGGIHPRYLAPALFRASGRK